MNYFDSKENVEEYVRRSEGYDGRELIDILKKHLKPGSKVLELGMGPGKDLDILAETFVATGSDMSKPFLERYKKINKNADLILLDAITIETDRKFDCIYSNKVLHLISKDELKQSLRRQYDVLLKDGLLFHTFWEGDKEEMYRGILSFYYTIDYLKEITEKDFDLVKIDLYTEYSKDDSVYLIVKKK